jgi:hypothetical protein
MSIADKVAITNRLYAESLQATKQFLTNFPCRSKKCDEISSQIEGSLKQWTSLRQNSSTDDARLEKERAMTSAIRAHAVSLFSQIVFDYPEHADRLKQMIPAQSKSCNAAESSSQNSLASINLEDLAPVSDCNGFRHQICNAGCYGAAIVAGSTCFALPPPFNASCVYGVYIVELACMGGCFASHCM